MLDMINHGMLSSPQIALLAAHDYLITNYDEKYLRAATYDMRISGPVVQHVNGIPVEYNLCDEDDANLKKIKSVTLERNSLTYVTTYEKFNLPKNFIARYNLKSKWVHRGLLLGTGPIVDPEMEDRLLIPIHNFSSEKVVIRNMRPLISVEFTKTLDTDGILIDDKNYPYIGNRSTGFNFHKYMERVGGDLPESSVDITLRESQKALKDTEDQYKKVQNYSYIAGIALLIGLITLVFSTWSILSDANKNISDAAAIIKKNEDNEIDLKGLATERELETIKVRLNRTEESLRTVVIPTPHVTEDLEVLFNRIEQLEKEISSMKSQLDTDSKKNDKNQK